MTTARSFTDLVRRGSLDLPMPADGEGAERLLRLCDIARNQPVGVARLAEAHTDAVAILTEAGRTAPPDVAYGVWASEQPGEAVVLDRATWTVSGRKPFGTGVGIVDRALITVVDSDGTRLLLDVDVTPSSTVVGETVGWATSALSDTATAAIVLDEHPVGPDDVVGGPDWYLTRPGFWHGACGPAACWAGSAIALADTASRLVDDDPHRRAQHGALVAARWSLLALLVGAGSQMDDAHDDAAEAEFVARSLRQVVERTCTDVLDRFGRAFGPRPFTSDVDTAQRAHDLHLYLRQHHGERELGSLSTLVS
ncbi:hypothetical protein [Ilumatobacter sp.]|uniref:hypothetical protein n=1 Tax=Ilumatobacter sp. TaxID=1967498 RepID=UPI003B52222E